MKYYISDLHFGNEKAFKKKVDYGHENRKIVKAS